MSAGHRIIRAADCRRMPWKNGGGETIEIAVSPPDAGLDHFDWRVSRARVDAGGPFSSFPGIERTLAILDGEGLLLEVGDAPAVRLDGSTPPHSFAADVATKADLVAGPVVDFNVMSRRGRIKHSVRRLAVSGEVETLVSGGDVLVFCASGEVSVAWAKETALLGPGDTVLIEGMQGVLQLKAASPADVFAVAFSALK